MFLALEDDFTGLHRSARYENDRNVDPQRRHQHSRRNLVAVGDTYHRIGAVGVDHVLYAIGDQIARRQRIEHPVMAHRDPVIDSDGIEFLGNTASCLNLTRDQLADILEVHVARHKLRKAVHHGNDRLAEITVLHTRSAPQTARSCHIAAVRAGAGTIGGHGRLQIRKLWDRCLGAPLP